MRTRYTSSEASAMTGELRGCLLDTNVVIGVLKEFAPAVELLRSVGDRKRGRSQLAPESMGPISFPAHQAPSGSRLCASRNAADVRLDYEDPATAP